MLPSCNAQDAGLCSPEQLQSGREVQTVTAMDLEFNGMVPCATNNGLQPSSPTTYCEVPERSTKYESLCGLNPSGSWRMETNAELERVTEEFWAETYRVSGNMTFWSVWKCQVANDQC